MKIQKLDASVKDITDVLKGAKGDEIYCLVQRGYGIADAYTLVHGEELQQQREARLRQALQNEFRGKEHLTDFASNGQEQPNVPPEIMAEFQRMLPNATKEQICRFYQKDQKSVKRRKG